MLVLAAAQHLECRHRSRDLMLTTVIKMGDKACKDCKLADGCYVGTPSMPPAAVFRL